MKKLKTILIVVVILGAMGFILVNNKQEIDERAAVKPEIKHVPVTVVPVSRQQLSENVAMIGTFAPDREVRLISEVQGKIVRLNVAEGSVVKSGTVIAQVDNELIQARLVAAEANYEKARRDVARYENLSRGNATTDVQVEGAQLALKTAESELRSLRKQLDNTTITAPIAGTITARSVEYGSVLMPGTSLVDITDISRLKLTIRVPEKDILKYRAGQTIAVKADVYPGHTFEGKVTMVGVKSDNAHNYPVEILVNNPAERPLKAGMYGRAILDVTEKEPVLVIPRTALVGSVKNPQVFVANGERAVLKNIQVGQTSAENIEVLSGLNSGEPVIVSGQINLEDNTLITIVN